MIHNAWCYFREVPYWYLWSSVKFQGHTAKNTSILTQIGHFGTVTPAWIHWWLWNDEQSLKQHQAVSTNRILWVYTRFCWYHGILMVHLQDSVGAFWAIKDLGTSIRGLSVENVMADGLSRVCSWWCIMLFLITKITGIYFVGDQC